MERKRDEPSGRLNPAFGGIPSFLRAPICPNLGQLNADIAVMGVPTDEGSPFMPGARFGPRAVREHSLRFGAGGRGLYDPVTGRQFLEEELSRGRLVDVGDVDVLPTNVPGTFENVTDMTQQILERGALPVVLGGDHSITFPVVRAYQEPIHVVHFDAHTDYSPFTHGLELTNGHAFRHIGQMAHVKSLTQVGIRGLRNSRISVEDSRANGNRVITMEEFRRISAEGIICNLPKDSRCYVSLDIDALDLSQVPGCVSAEPDGMTYGQLRDALVVLVEHSNVVGFDLVEVNPQLDVGTGITAYLATHLVLEFLGHICAQPRWSARRGIVRTL